MSDLALWVYDRLEGEMMSKLHTWLLTYITKRAVIQGPDHCCNIVKLYIIIAAAVKDEFYEDNQPTLEAFLKSCYEISICKVLPLGRNNEKTSNKLVI